MNSFTKTMFHSLLLAAILAHAVVGYSFYKARIPNGDLVPHPCKPNTYWQGVGHFLDAGTGLRNPFGLDFADEGSTWTQSLCRRDSDGDGRTNGEELGDPYCLWSQNGIPTQTAGITHPGICDPWDSPKCLLKNVTHAIYKNQGDWLRGICKAGEFVCPAKNETGTLQLNLQLNRTNVPSKATTYICQMFDLETMFQPGDYHMVAVEPFIDNAEVVHHMVLFGCRDDQEMISAPFECGMVATSKCQSFLSVWTVGLAGDCAHPMAGIKLGQGGYKRIALQYHWNNPNLRTDWTDASGMKLYYTPLLRQYDAGIIVFGSQSFVIPPRRPSFTVTSTCTQGCTRSLMANPINLTMAWNHMHYAGVKMSIEIKRNNVRFMNLTNDPVYSYDSPQVYSYIDRPITLYAGDELITKCTYNTTTRNHSTLWGEGTYDEMCYGFVSFYPKANLGSDFCISAGPDISYCDGQPAADQGCPYIFTFFDSHTINASNEYQQLVQNCQPFSPCLEECVQYIVQLQKSSSCFRGQLFELIKSDMLSRHEVGRDMMARIASCDAQAQSLLYTPTTGYPVSTTKRYSNIDAGGQFAKASVATATFFVVSIALILSIA